MKKSAVISIILAASFWGIISIFVRHLTALGYTSMELVSVRALITAVSLIIFIAATNRELLKVKLKDCRYFIGTGILSFVFFNFCYLNAINTVSVSVAAILLYTSPIFVTVMSAMLFKEKFTKIKVVALILAFLGCILVTGVLSPTTVLNAKGLIFGVLSGFGYALYSIFGRYALNKYSSLTVTAYTFVFASIGVLPFISFPHFYSVAAKNPISVFWLVALAIVTGIIPYVLYTYGLSHIESGKASIIACIEPVVATLTGIIVFNELLSIGSIIGIVLVMTAVILLNAKTADTSK